jgi:hypothetical protein
MEAVISYRGRLTIGFLAILASGPAYAQSEDALLREFSAAERASIRRACYGAGLFGPARFYTCVAQKADELRQSPGEPSLIEFSPDEQSSIRRACYGAGLFGPARLYACLRQKADELRQSPGHPSLAEFSGAEQASIRRACYGAGLFGPARLYACLRQKADELRDVRRRLKLASPLPTPEVSYPSTSPVASDAGGAPPPVPLIQVQPAPTSEEASPTPAPLSSMSSQSGAAAATPLWPALENQRVSERLVSERAPQLRTARGSGTNTSVNGIKSVAQVPAESAASPATGLPSRQSPSSSALEELERRRKARRPTATRREDDGFLVFAFWLTVGAVIWAVNYFRGSRPAPPPVAGQNPGATPPPPRRDTYRASRAHARHSGITFADPRTDTLWSPHETDLTDVRDAITGQPLRPALGLHRCMRCHVFYETASVECIQRENGGRCISCGSASVSPVNGASAVEESGRGDPDADITTLDNYRQRVGQLVVFEGRCVRVLPSRSGTAYAVMFEHGTWTEGFKLVVRTGFVAHVGGDDFIRSLAGRTVRARGVIAHSPVFGYEITITTRSMILGVR